jgi:hypothetical protein
MKQEHSWFWAQFVHMLFVSVLLLTLISCGGGDDNELHLRGTYTGTVQDSRAGTGTIQITLAQSDSSVTGTVQTTFANSQFNNSGTFTGTVSGSSVTITFSPSNPTSCPYNATLTVNGNQLTGTYATFNCTVAASGSITLTRQ